jgi:osmoprotectant transport system permease protein
VDPTTLTCLQRNAWICPDYLVSRQDLLLGALREHVELTVVSLLIGTVVSIPLGVIAFRTRRIRSLILGGSTVIYTIPSLAMFSLLVPYTGLTANTVVLGLVLYSLTIIVRNVVVGLDGVPDDVEDSALSLGYTRRTLLLRVQLPLALPTIFAGLRVAATSTVALATLGVLVGVGGFGNPIFSGLRSNFRAEVLTASVAVVVLAVLFDLVLLLVQRGVSPWARAAR